MQNSLIFTSNFSSQNYSPFGMVMPGRSFTNENYRFGFNGMEDNSELTDVYGSHLDFGARIYDSRLGKFMSTDPWEYKYAWQTPYAYFKNSPISTIDFMGKGGEGDDAPTKKGDKVETPNGVVEASIDEIVVTGNNIPSSEIGPNDANPGASAMAGYTSNDNLKEYNQTSGTNFSTHQDATNTFVNNTINIAQLNYMKDFIHRIEEGFNNVAPFLAIPITVIGGATGLISYPSLFSIASTKSELAFALGNGLTNFGTQMLANDGDWRKVNYTSVLANSLFKNPFTASSISGGLAFTGDGYNGFGNRKSSIIFFEIGMGTATNYGIGRSQTLLTPNSSTIFKGILTGTVASGGFNVFGTFIPAAVEESIDD